MENAYANPMMAPAKMMYLVLLLVLGMRLLFFAIV